MDDTAGAVLASVTFTLRRSATVGPAALQLCTVALCSPCMQIR
ncbi:hypothetical protein XCR_4197 [Xanthomonas campestris pv. raphani 756C]|nr:hypothetical protein XCR_4197 [Xanthomonas campestris pv. raphani 756C]